jgi:hypothetical protein
LSWTGSQLPFICPIFARFSWPAQSENMTFRGAILRGRVKCSQCLLIRHSVTASPAGPMGVGGRETNCAPALNAGSMTCKNSTSLTPTLSSVRSVTYPARFVCFMAPNGGQRQRDKQLVNRECSWPRSMLSSLSTRGDWAGYGQPPVRCRQPRKTADSSPQRMRGPLDRPESGQRPRRQRK